MEGTQEERKKTRLGVIDQVRRSYYAVVEAQSALDSLQSSLPFYEESKRLASVNLQRETILESDLLRADTQLLNTRNAISDARDRVATAAETLNDLMGRDVHTQFRVAAIGDADTDLATPEAMEARALQHRPYVKKAKPHEIKSKMKAHKDAAKAKREDARGPVLAAPAPKSAPVHPAAPLVLAVAAED